MCNKKESGITIMTATSQYWNFVEVGTNGNCRIREIETARNF
ncbi:MAG: hypothetical protein SWX82_12040 [Cyanobacteriota bacterium]|nr:hypothetical protein [Cyanobacteriota bacterium]